MIEREPIRGIYRIVNTNNEKCYIGKSEDIGSRIRNHIRTLRGGYNKNKHLQNAYSHYDRGTFYVEILETLDQDEDINEREKYWIKQFNSSDREFGYNRTLGGDGGNGYVQCMTDEEIVEHNRKMSEIRTGKNNPLYGKHMYTNGISIKYISDDEIDEYESNGWHPGAPDYVKEIEREANLGEKNGFWGKKHSQETKEKISKSRSGELNCNYGKHIYHKGEMTKYISDDEVEQYELDGWIKGLADKTKEKISATKTGRKRDKPNKNTVKYLYNEMIFYGWRRLKEFLNQNGYPKISEAAILKLADGKHVRGYDELFGKIQKEGTVE